VLFRSVGLFVRRTKALVLPVVIDGTPQVDPAWDAFKKTSRSSLRFLPVRDYEGSGMSAQEIAEDLRAASKLVKGYTVHSGVEQALVVPGSHLVKEQAEAEGLDKIFSEAGFEWREAGCSMCLAMNPDKLESGERCASTSNRNFEGRQGKGGRTHLVSPAMATAAIFSFIWTYDDFLGPLIYLNDMRQWTVPLALRAFVDASGGESLYGELFAMSTLSLLPVFAVFLIFQRMIIRGIALGALKG